MKYDRLDEVAKTKELNVSHPVMYWLKMNVVLAVISLGISGLLAALSMQMIVFGIFLMLHILLFCICVNYSNELITKIA